MVATTHLAAAYRPGDGYTSGALEALVEPDFFAPAEPHEIGVLFSFHYYGTTDLVEFVGGLKYEPSVFVDSGGFSAWSQGAVIDPHDYARWIRRNAKVISHYANLDEIGDARGTLRNQMKLERMGLRPLPVIHLGSSVEELRRYKARGYDYLCLGGLVPNMKLVRSELRAGGGRTIDWLDELHVAAAELEVGLHGFGVTNWPLLLRYQWRSVDSSSWSSGYRFGNLNVFDPEAGRWHNFNLRDRSKIMKLRGLIRRYGCNPVSFIRDSGLAKTRPEVVRLAARSWLVAQRWLNASPRDLRKHLAGTADVDFVDAGAALTEDWTDDAQG